MVQGVEVVRRQLAAVPEIMETEVRKAISASATALVAQMNSLKPDPSIVIGWTWGDAPANALTVGRVSGEPRQGVYATIYATGPLLENARVPVSLAKVFEFGTKMRRQRTTGRSTGMMPAQPFFYPAYRANRRSIRSRVAAAVRRAAKQLNAT